MKSSNVFILTEFISPEINSTGYYWNNIATSLSSELTGVTCISPRSSTQFEGSNFNLIEFDLYFKNNKENLFIRSLYQVELIIKMILISKKHASSNDIFFTGTNPALMVFFIPILRKLTSAKWIILSHDVFPENLVSAGIFKRKNIIFKALKKVVDYVISSSDGIIVIGRDMQEVMIRKHRNGSKDNINYIPNFYPPELDNKNIEPTFNSTSGISNLSFSYFGNFGRVQAIPSLLKVINEAQIDNIKYFFIGDGACKNLLEEYAFKENFIFIDQIPFKDFQQGLKYGDIGIVTLSSDMYGLAVPSKAYFYIGSRKKVLYLGPKNSELHRMIIKNPNLGWYADINNLDECTFVLRNIALQFNNNQLKLGLSDHDIQEFKSDIVLARINKFIKKFLNYN